MKTLPVLFLLLSPLLAITPQQIIKNVEHNLQSDSGYSRITMVVTTSRGKRTVKLQSWNKGNEKSFMKILYPKKDRGITFLKIDNVMWQYVPKIEKTIKIPSSMMMQSWMGSDFTNDDMVKESSIVKDYHTELTAEEEDKYVLTLIPKEDAAVVWGKIIMEVDKEHFVPLKAVYYDEDDVRQRVLYYKAVEKIGDRYYPAVMELQPALKRKNKTVVRMEDVDFDATIESSRFTKSALTRYSR